MSKEIEELRQEIAELKARVMELEVRSGDTRNAVSPIAGQTWRHLEDRSLWIVYLVANKDEMVWLAKGGDILRERLVISWEQLKSAFFLVQEI